MHDVRYNNLAALEMYRSNAGQAQSELATAIEQANDTLFEPLYNAAVLKNSVSAVAARGVTPLL